MQNSKYMKGISITYPIYCAKILEAKRNRTNDVAVLIGFVGFSSLF